MRHQPEACRNRYQRLLDGDDHDPLAGVANLFDVAMVFAVALMVALFASSPASNLLLNRGSLAESNAQLQQNSIPHTGDRLERFQIGDREAGGQGERLGIAYRLPSGEVIYVPETRNVSR